MGDLGPPREGVLWSLEAPGTVIWTTGPPGGVGVKIPPPQRWRRTFTARGVSLRRNMMGGW